ncbi:E3 ubiquitin-protein ligase FANCL isoform X2 [Coffea eugenioides]|uniref:E3 ubiquitin-protein ligase FANCL isoform X2 n=1 Tax=Coffea eugenioides TaxID=49369 RepID=UPI000F60522D|nr:E3 ubiquitin-protein ligase FANCL isoform X2 [Coffea eugenioides]
MLIHERRPLLTFCKFSAYKNGGLSINIDRRLDMEVNMEDADGNRCQKLGKSSSFYRRIYSEVEDVGWEHLVRMGEDLTYLSFRVIDKKGRAHILEITLDTDYPKCPPSISADVPHIFNLDWSRNSKLKDAVVQFQHHVDKLQDFWSTLDDIDRSLWVVDPKDPHFAMSYRQINIGNDCYITLSVNASDPRSLPQVKDRSFSENLTSILDIELPQPPEVRKDDRQTECGVCYAQYLPIDDELGSKSGSATDYTCENNNCSRAFHSVCLRDWLRSITTTRQSFDVLFGNCPYCSNPVAVKIINKK